MSIDWSEDQRHAISDAQLKEWRKQVDERKLDKGVSAESMVMVMAITLDRLVSEVESQREDIALLRHNNRSYQRSLEGLVERMRKDTTG